MEPICKSSQRLTRGLFPQKSSTTDLRPDSKCRFDWRCCECWVWMDCKCMVFIAAGWCKKKWLRFDQTKRNLMAKSRSLRKHLTSQLSWAATWLLVICGNPVYLVLDELRPCVLRSLMIGLMVVLLTFFDMMSMVLLRGSWCYSREWVWNLRANICCIASGSEM